MHALPTKATTLLSHRQIQDMLRRTPAWASEIATHQRLQTDLGLRRQLTHLLSLTYNRRGTKSTLRNMHPPELIQFN
jgi:hypothetical protein